MGISPIDCFVAYTARVIQEELLKDLGDRSELSDWFSREETTPAVVVKKPNPKNIQNAEKIKELEEQIQRYVISATCEISFLKLFKIGKYVEGKENKMEATNQKK